MSPSERDALLSRLIGEVWPFAPLLEAFSVSPQARVLDLGGGGGGLLAELERRGHSGRRELIDPAHGGDAHALPFQDAAFDVVFMLRVLAHLHAPALALQEARRVLAAGGRLVVAAHGADHLAELLPAGEAAAFPFALPGLRVQPFEVSRPVDLSGADQRQLAASYGLSGEGSATVRSRVQLSGWVLTRVA